MRSPDSILADLVDVQEILAALAEVPDPQPDPTSSLTIERRQYEAEATVLREELDLAAAPRLDVVLSGTPVVEHTVDASVLARVIGRLQDVVDAIGQALEGPPTARGLIARDVTGQSRLRVAATFAGSFGVHFRGPNTYTEPDLHGRLEDSLMQRALSELMQLVDLAGKAAADQDAAIIEAVLPLGQRTLSHLRDLAGLLASSNTEVALRLYRPDHEDDTVELRQALARRLQQVLTRTVVEEETVPLEGLLGGASQFTNRFELKVGDRTYRGKVADDLVLALASSFGRLVRAQVLVRRATLDDASAPPQESFTLVGLEPA